jgi:hypothetical protein
MLALFLIRVIIHKINKYPLSPKGKGKTHCGIFCELQTTHEIERFLIRVNIHKILAQHMCIINTI